MLQETLDLYAQLACCYQDTEQKLLSPECEWHIIEAFMQKSETLIKALRHRESHVWNAAEAQQLKETAEHCASLHRRIGMAMQRRRETLKDDVNQQQRVSKALHAYQSEQRTEPRFQDKHL